MLRMSLWLQLSVLSIALTKFSYASELSTTLKIFEPPTNNATTIVNTFSSNNKLKSFSSEISDENIANDYEEENDDYDEDDNNATGARMKPSRQKHIIKRVGTTYVWDRWEKWSKCSNSCVQIRRRKCMERKLTSLGAAPIDREFYPEPNSRFGCFGIIKRYRHCKDEKCKANKKRQRDEQCATFNSTPYRGEFYNWLGYEKEHNECELFCRPSGSGKFVSMNQSVTDGTDCDRPAVYYTHYYRRKAVCVEGICRVSSV